MEQGTNRHSTFLFKLLISSVSSFSWPFNSASIVFRGTIINLGCESSDDTSWCARDVHLADTLVQVHITLQLTDLVDGEL